MKGHIRIAGLFSLVALCSVFIACESDPFIGTWKPDPAGDAYWMPIKSFYFNKDGTFSVKFKDATRKELKGTYTKTGNKIDFSSPDLKQKFEAIIESDGRMKTIENGPKPVYFVKAKDFIIF